MNTFQIFVSIFFFFFGCFAWAFSSYGEWSLLFISVYGLLIGVASLVAEHRL